MRGVFKGLRGSMLLVSLLLAGVSCQDFSSTVFGSSNVDTINLVEDIHFDHPIKPLLLDKWDSLKRNQITFEVDTLNPISIKDQKKQLKDSLVREFAKKPKHVYLTFDDGPLVGSFAIDSLAKAKNVKLNTFLVGKHAKMGKGRQRDLERYQKNPLISCYNHSYTHAGNQFVTFYNNVQLSYDDFIKNQKELNLTHKIARLPGRNIWIYDDIKRKDLNSGFKTADSLFTNGYKVFGWDVEWRINSLTGVPVQSFKVTLDNIHSHMNNPSKAHTPNNVVLLMHDDMFQTRKGRQLLADLIDALKKEDYQFEFMEDYPIKY